MNSVPRLIDVEEVFVLLEPFENGSRNGATASGSPNSSSTFSEVTLKKLPIIDMSRPRILTICLPNYPYE
jgi:hypothetical protein